MIKRTSAIVINLETETFVEGHSHFDILMSCGWDAIETPLVFVTKELDGVLTFDALYDIMGIYSKEEAKEKSKKILEKVLTI